MAGCPIFPLAEFEAVNPAFAREGRWNEVLKGRIEGLHLLASPMAPQENRQALVVDFREIFSLPHDYLAEHAKQLGPRWRLKPPFLDTFRKPLRDSSCEWASLRRYLSFVDLPSGGFLHNDSAGETRPF